MTAVYAHIPYCLSKCPYCDFVSIPIDGSEQNYLAALIKEAENVDPRRRVAETLYIGGGTPTALSAQQIEWLLARLRDIFEIAPTAEITVEANPCSLIPAKVNALAAGGINRVSLGAQSFVADELSLLGRRHTVREVEESYGLLRRAGIANISLDLIYAIPGQSPRSWRHSLSKAIELRPEHISTYCLTFEPGTPFWNMLKRGDIEKKSEEEELELYEIAREMLGEAGYEHYEISNFALHGKRSLHNTSYWRNEEYLGLGSSAVSYIDGVRITNARDVHEYISAVTDSGNGAVEREEIPPFMQAVETAIQRLRLREGIECSSFAERFGIHPRELFGVRFSELVELGLLEHRADTIRCSSRGWHLANEVALRALP
jgi:oxygen-independent coproporphyrinogen-3 oxidase